MLDSKEIRIFCEQATYILINIDKKCLMCFNINRDLILGN